jgi:dUTP pyrophosphatase
MELTLLLALFIFVAAQGAYVSYLFDKKDPETKIIKIKYFNKEITQIEKIQQGDWIDLRTSKKVEMKAGDYVAIPLGLGMILPEGFEAIVAPRSSTFKKYGVLLANSIGIIDNSFSGEEDEWHVLFYATRDIKIPMNERVCQFRIQPSMGKPNIEIVDKLHSESRGGFGSTDK